MSNRNSRVIRNRDNNSFKIKNTKFLILIIIIIILLIFCFIFIKNRKLKLNSVDDIQNINYEYFVLSKNDKVGVIDKKGNDVIDAIYSMIYIPNPEKDVFLCYDEIDECTILNKKGKKIFENYENIEVITSSNNNGDTEKYLLKYKKDNLYGLIDLDGNLVSDAIYDKILSMKDRPGRILVKKDDKYGVLDMYGNLFIDLKYDKILSDEYSSSKDSYSKTGYIIAKKNNNGIEYGYINYKGNIVLDTKYESIKRVLEYNDNNVYLIVMQKGKKGVFKNNKKIIDFSFQDINYSDLSNIFIVNKNGKYGFYNLNGRVILKPKYSQYSVAGNYISVIQNDKTKLYDINGNLVDTTSYKRMIETENPSYFIAQDDDGYYSIISKDIKIDRKYIQIYYAFDNYFVFTNADGKTGVINALIDEIEIEPKYDFIILIDGTKSLEAVDGINNLIDIYSKDLVKTVTVEDGTLEKINSEYCAVYSDKDLIYIDSNGEVVLNTAIYKDSKLYAIQKNGKWGFCDKTEKIIVKCEYDIVTELNEYGFAGIKKAGKWGIIDEDGNILVQPTYVIDSYYFPQFIGKYLLIQTEDVVYCEDIYIK